MVEKTFNERIYELSEKLTIEHFDKPGNAGEIKFGIFDYDPADELKVRREIQ